MLYNVAQLLREGIGGVRHVRIEGHLQDLDELNPGPTAVHGEAQLLRVPRGVLATGKAVLHMAQECRRCLALHQAKVTIEVEEEFIPSIDIDTGATLPLTDEDEAELVIDEHHILDLTEVLRQLALAAGAEAGLCRPDCHGLCPFCGADLNDGACGCQVAPGDPRWAALSGLVAGLGDR